MTRLQWNKVTMIMNQHEANWIQDHRTPGQLLYTETMEHVAWNRSWSVLDQHIVSQYNSQMDNQMRVIACCFSKHEHAPSTGADCHFKGMIKMAVPWAIPLPPRGILGTTLVTAWKFCGAAWYGLHLGSGLKYKSKQTSSQNSGESKHYLKPCIPFMRPHQLFETIT